MDVRLFHGLGHGAPHFNCFRLIPDIDRFYELRSRENERFAKCLVAICAQAHSVIWVGGHTLFDYAQTYSPECNEQYFCRCFTSPSSTGSRKMIPHNTGSTWGAPLPRAKQRLGTFSAFKQSGAADAFPSHQICL